MAGETWQEMGLLNSNCGADAAEGGANRGFGPAMRCSQARVAATLSTLGIALGCLHVPLPAQAEVAAACQPGGAPAAGRFRGSAALQLAHSRRDSSCFLSSSELRAWRERGSVTFVDVRAADMYRSFHAPGSLNIPLRMLRHKSFLKDRQVVLLHEEPSTELFEGACQDLRAAGFSRVAALDGGLHEWPDDFGELVGEMPRAAVLSPQSLFQESLYDHWLFVNASDRDLLGSDLVPPSIVQASMSVGEKKFLAEVGEALAARRAAGGATLMAVFDEDGASNLKIQRSLASIQIHGAYFVEGGLAAYLSFRKQRDLMVARAAQPWGTECR